MCWADVAPGMTATPTSSAQRSSTCALVAFAAAAIVGTLPRIRFFFSFADPNEPYATTAMSCALHHSTSSWVELGTHG